MLGGDLRCTSCFRPQAPDPFTPAIFRSRVQSICCETTHSVKKRSASTQRNSHPPLSTFTNTVSFTGKFGYPNSYTFSPFPHNPSYMLTLSHDNQGHKAGQHSPRRGRPCSSDRLQCSILLLGHETTCVSGRLDGIHSTRSNFASRVYIHP